MTDYTRQHANKLRAVTVAGELANIIRQIQQNAPLFVVPASVFASGSGGGTGGTCGLTFNPTSVSLTIPTNDTGSVAATVTVTSAIAQTVTFCAFWASGGGGANPCTAGTSPDPCVGAPIVTPSTFTFTAGQSTTIVIVVPYTNCTTVGLSGTLGLGAVTDTGCVVNNALISGTVTTSSTGTFALEVACSELNGDGCLQCARGSGYNVWGSTAVSVRQSTPCGFIYSVCHAPFGGCPCDLPNAYGFGDLSVRLRSINGFAGTVTLTGVWYYAGGWYPLTSYSLSAGQITGAIGSIDMWNWATCSGVTSGSCPGCAGGGGSCSNTRGCTYVATATSGAITRTVGGITNIADAFCWC